MVRQCTVNLESRPILKPWFKCSNERDSSTRLPPEIRLPKSMLRLCWAPLTFFASQLSGFLLARVRLGAPLPGRGERSLRDYLPLFHSVALQLMSSGAQLPSIKGSPIESTRKPITRWIHSESYLGLGYHPMKQDSEDPVETRLHDGLANTSRLSGK